MKKLTLSITPELDAALELLALRELEGNKSRAIEIYLRESDRVQHYIDIVRSEPDETVFAAPGRHSKLGKRAKEAVSS